jgi:putative hydrolase of the HAD superfamily
VNEIKALDGVRCVVFDIDDTLYLERDYVCSGFRSVEATSGITGLAWTCWQLFVAGIRRDTFDQALIAHGRRATPELISHLVEAYRTHAPDIRLAADARACLGELESFALATVSDGPLASQQAKVDALHLQQWIPHIVLTAGLGPQFGKPHPLAFEIVQARVGLAGGEVAYVADNPMKDFEGPRSLGWRTVRIRRAGSLREGIPSDDRVDIELPNLAELPGLIRAI